MLFSLVFGAFFIACFSSYHPSAGMLILMDCSYRELRCTGDVKVNTCSNLMMKGAERPNYKSPCVVKLKSSDL